MAKTSKYLVYGLFDPSNGAIRYVGKSCYGRKRIKQHWTPSRLANSNDRARSKAWCKSILAKGLMPDGDVLEYYNSPQEAAEGEQFWIGYLRMVGADLVNHTRGGEGAPGQIKSPETREKLRLANLGNTYSLGKPKNFSIEQLAKYAERARERSAYPLVRAKISATLKGRKTRPCSEETKAKISKALMGHKPNPGSGRRSKEAVCQY